MGKLATRIKEFYPFYPAQPLGLKDGNEYRRTDADNCNCTVNGQRLDDMGKIMTPMSVLSTSLGAFSNCLSGSTMVGTSL